MQIILLYASIFYYVLGSILYYISLNDVIIFYMTVIGYWMANGYYALDGIMFFCERYSKHFLMYFHSAVYYEKCTLVHTFTLMVLLWSTTVKALI